MKHSRTVLHLGYDSLLSEARAHVLENAGYRVLDASDVAAAQRFCRGMTVDLLIVCHSVPPEDAEAVIAETRKRRPHVPVLVVHVGGLTSPQRAQANGFVDGLRGPEHLIARVGNFLGADQHPSGPRRTASPTRQSQRRRPRAGDDADVAAAS